MRRLLILTSLMAASAPTLAAERDCSLLPMSTAEQRITKQVCDGLDYRDAYRDALAMETAAREALGFGIPDDYTRKQTLKRWGLAMEALEPARQGMEENFRDALNETLVLYGIAPSEGSGGINGGPVKGGRAVWAPNYVFRTNPGQEILREVNLPAQSGRPARKAHLKWQQSEVEEEKALAMTWADGRVDILDEALEAVVDKNSPRILGYLIHHESVHFDQLRKGNWATLNEREVDAYKVSITEASRFGLSPDEVKGLNKLLGYNRAKVWKQKIGWEKPPRDLPRPAAEAVYRTEWDKLRKALQEDIPAERKKLQERLELERAGRNAPGQTPEGNNAEEERNPLDILESLSKYFCENPQYIRSLTRAHEVWGDTLGKVPSILVVLDLDYQFGTMSCADYVAFQAIFLHRSHFDSGAVSSILGLVDEGLVRQTQSNPRGGRVSLPPASPGQTPDPLPIPTDPRSPDVTDLPRDRTPSIPHCRYHDWCKEPGK